MWIYHNLLHDIWVCPKKRDDTSIYGNLWGTVMIHHRNSGVSYLKTKPICFFSWSKRPRYRWEGTECNDYILDSLLLCTIFPQGSGCWSWRAECQHWECRAVPTMVCHAYFENQKGMGHKIRPPTHKVLLLFAIHHIHRCLEVIYQAILLRYAGMPISYHQNLSDAWYS